MTGVQTCALPISHGVHPLIGGAAVDEKRPRGHQCDQHMAVDWHVVPASNPLLVIAAQLPGVVLRHVINGFAPIAAGEGRSRLAADSGKRGKLHEIAPRFGDAAGIRVKG